MILHIPHSSTIIPNRSDYIIDDLRLDQEMLLLTDWHTDDLFSAPDGEVIIAKFSRIFCDVERFADDTKEVMSNVGMGVTYKKCDDGSDLRKLTDRQRATILNKYYYPHHKKLSKAIGEEISKNDNALIIDCHSFSNKPFKRDMSQSQPRPDFCLGTDDFHTPRGLYKYAAVILKCCGYTVGINMPYSGSIVPSEYYNKDKRVNSLMIEINRDLYLLPGTNKKNENYDNLKLFIKDFLKKLSELEFKKDTADILRISEPNNNI